MGSAVELAETNNNMGEFKHLVIVKFKEEVVEEEILKGLENMVAEIDSVKSFEWGKDLESQDMLRQGFTHAFLTTFDNKEDYAAFVGHPKHLEFSATFSTVLEKIVLLDFPTTLVKAPPKEATPKEAPPKEAPSKEAPQA